MMNKLVFAMMLLKYLAGAVMLGMLFALSWAGKFPVDTLGTLLVGGFTALCGHAAGSRPVSPDGGPRA
jgi:hypothetical protein